MDGVQIEIDDEEVQAAFDRLLRVVDDPGPALDAIGRVLKSNIQRCFLESRSPYGETWAPLKARKGKPLVNDGHLQNSIDYQVDSPSVVVGTNKVQATIQNFGGVIAAKNSQALFFMVGDRKVFVKSVTIPARQFMPTDGLPDDWRDDAVDVAQEILRKVIEP